VPGRRAPFVGWERADSSVVNPHKWLFTPLDASLLLTRRMPDLRAAFSLVPEYLRTPDEVVSLSEVSIPLGRPFRALRLWAVLRCYGRSGLQAQIREHVRLAALFESWVRDEPGWAACAPRPFSVVCFRRDGSDEENEALLERVNASGEIFISHTRLNGHYTLRLAIGNLHTTEAHVRRAWELLRARAHELRSSIARGA
jgi:aromatic-L-amino-acid/L-tryptophan decarboxylase